MNRFVATCLLFATSAFARDTHGPFETKSLLGRPLYALTDDGTIAAAQQKLAADPKSAKLAVALSKAQAGRRQYKEAVATCTKALKFSPDDADLFLERGHRELGLREFRKAQSDLERATKLNPQQLDNFYHLGLSFYFQREFSKAAESFRQALGLARTNDSVIDCSNWLYVSLRRAGDKAAAAQVLTRITPDIQNKEPHLLFYLKLLHFYQGTATKEQTLSPKPMSPDDTETELSFNTTSYGVGNWHLYNGEPKVASELFQPVVQGQAWNSWGFIGSELELARK